MVARRTTNNGRPAPPLQYLEIVDPVETEDDADDIAWALRSSMWRTRVEKASARRTKRAKATPALTLAGHGVSLRIVGGALTIQNGFTHYPQQRETFRYFRGDLSLPERIFLLDGSGSVSFDVLSWLAEQKVSLIRIDWKGDIVCIAGASGYSANPFRVRWQLETRENAAKRNEFCRSLERDEFGLNRRGFPNRRFSDSGCWLEGGQHGWEGLIRTIFVSGRSERFCTADFRAIERRLSSALGSARSSTGCGGFTRRAAWRRARWADTSRRRSATGTRPFCPSAFGKEPSRCAGWWRNSPGAGSRSTIARCGISSTRRSSVSKKKRRGERARTARRRAKAGAMEEASGPDRARASGVH